MESQSGVGFSQAESVFKLADANQDGVIQATIPNTDNLIADHHPIVPKEPTTCENYWFCWYVCHNSPWLIHVDSLKSKYPDVMRQGLM